MKLNEEVNYKDNTGSDRIGVLVGVQRAEIDGEEKVIGYLVDTGVVERSETIRHNVLQEELDRRITEFVNSVPVEDRGEDFGDVVNGEFEKIRSAKDLPKAEIVEETINYPLVITVSAEKVSAVK